MKKVRNIKPVEVIEDGQSTVQYKGRDGKFHNIAADSAGSGNDSGNSNQNIPSPQGEQSVEVGDVSIVDHKPTITLDELLPDKFYRIVADNGRCLIATQMEMVEVAEIAPARGMREELAIRIIGNSTQGIDSNIVETITLDEEEHWVITLSGWASNPVMTMLSEHDTLMELTLNHQELFEEFLNYSLLGSASYDNHGGYFGSFTPSEDGWIICDKDMAGRNGTLTLAINLGNGASERKIFKTFRLTNYAATIGNSFEFKESNGKLVMVNKTGDVIWGFSLFKLSGVLGTIVNYADESHAILEKQGSPASTYNWNSPKHGDKLLIESAHASVHINVWLNEEYYVDQTINFEDEIVMLEFLKFPAPTQSSEYVPYLVVNGVPRALNVSYQYSHGGM